MVRARTSMYNIRKILKLHFLNGLSGSAIGGSIDMSRPIVHKFLSHAVEVSLNWPTICDMPDSELQGVFFMEISTNKDLLGLGFMRGISLLMYLLINVKLNTERFINCC